MKNGRSVGATGNTIVHHSNIPTFHFSIFPHYIKWQTTSLDVNCLNCPIWILGCAIVKSKEDGSINSNDLFTFLHYKLFLNCLIHWLFFHSCCAAALTHSGLLWQQQSIRIHFNWNIFKEEMWLGFAKTNAHKVNSRWRSILNSYSWFILLTRTLLQLGRDAQT